MKKRSMYISIIATLISISGLASAFDSFKYMKQYVAVDPAHVKFTYEYKENEWYAIMGGSGYMKVFGNGKLIAQCERGMYTADSVKEINVAVEAARQSGNLLLFYTGIDVYTCMPRGMKKLAL